MGRSKARTRKTPKANPIGTLDIRSGGFGFVRSAEGEFFIPESKIGFAFPGDTVEIAPIGGSRYAVSGGKPTARVVRVVSRAHESIIGRYEVAEPFGVVVPEDGRIPFDIFTMRADNPTIADGSIVKVAIATYPDRNSAATGVIEEVLGTDIDTKLAIEMIIARRKLETTFSDGSLAEAQAAKLDIDGAFAAGYRDVRSRCVMTIDPADARDFDDALSVEQLSDGRYLVGVHIADVSAYVPWNSSIDFDARRRATSVYLPDRVIPMLPEELSNNLCSLVPGAPRLTMTVDVVLDANADVVSCEIYPAVIQSDARLTYDEVYAFLTGAQGAQADAQGAQGAQGARSGLQVTAQVSAQTRSDIERSLLQLHQLAEKLFAKRLARGGLDFEGKEARVVLDDEGQPTDIELRVRTCATSLVEEFMILANSVVAKEMAQVEFPCAYRVHEKPSPDGLFELLAVLSEFDWFSQVDREAFVDGNPHVLEQVLELSKPHPESELVSMLLLQAMKRALYRPSCDGHYGLALDYYTHFTSPIRRYPDLIVHRMLKYRAGVLQGPEESFKASLSWLCEHSSDAERIAEKASWESQEYLMIMYLERFVGCEFDAIISGVATYGIYVSLDNTAEGLIPSNDLGHDYFSFDPKRHTLTGQETGKVYRLGQKLRVRLKEADPSSKSLIFETV